MKQRMHLIPSNALEILEFDKVVDLLRQYCVGVQARNQCTDIHPATDPEWIKDELNTVRDVVSMLEEHQTIITSEYPPLEEILSKLRVEGYILDGVQILQIAMLLRQVGNVVEFFDDERKDSFPDFYKHTTALDDPGGLLVAIDNILDDEGEVKPEASPALKTLKKQMQSARSASDREFDKLLRQFTDKGWLADIQESVRNGRRVLAVLAEHKRSIRGIMHDQSASGKTAFLEPDGMIDLNNELVELEAEYRAEVRRILADLCDKLRPEIGTLELYEDVVTQLDLYLAKGRLARSMEATRPEITDQPNMHFDTAYHPLLKLKNEKLGKKTVPFDLVLQKGNRILLLSGPNAGGKSILMKSVGLLQVMIQSGLMVSVDQRSVFGIFRKLCVELGDRQSIENDLSTYSSRLLDMKEFMRQADRETLLLIDEFGSGTDPKLGGAIAEGILDAVCKKGVFGVLTTHYSELKVYAHKRKGVVNGAMIFDQESMSPSYILRVGKPGSSFAFEIAEQTGLPEEVINYARKRAGKNTRALEDLLIELESQKESYEKRLKILGDKQKHADRLVKNYERLQTDLTAQRKRLRLEQKQRDYQHLSQLNKDLEKAIRVIKEEKNLDQARKQLAHVKDVRKKTRESIERINEELEKRAVTQRAPLKEGDFVKLKNGKYTGKIERIVRKNATIIVGQVRMDVKLKDLEPASDPLDINPQVSVQSDLVTPTNIDFNPELDIRGLRADDAQSLVEKFLDGAMITNTSPVRIIHGKGTGALKRLVAEKLREYPVSDISNPEDQSGGSGVTVVEL